MTVKADKASLRIACCSTGIALLCLSPPPAAARDGPYLTWHNKTAPVQATGAPPAAQAPQVPVPPSPYGQVGDPFLHLLTWSNKTGSNKTGSNNTGSNNTGNNTTGTATSGGAAPQTAPPPQMATAAPVRRAPVQQTEPAYAIPHYAPPSYIPPAEPVPEQPAQPPARRPGPNPTVPAAANDGAYQIPASSPYAARVAAARAAQAKALAHIQAQAGAAKPAPSLQAAPQAAAHPTAQTAAAPAPVSQPLDNDKPFVPGEHYTDASEAPRLYSLHRAYGLKPDPITVDTNASGALLDTSDIDKAAAKAEKAADKTDDDGSSQADGAPAQSTHNTASASGTQNASDSKKNKAAQ